MMHPSRLQEATGEARDVFNLLGSRSRAREKHGTA